MNAPGLPRVHATVVHMLADAAVRSAIAEALVCRDQHLKSVRSGRAPRNPGRTIGG